MAKTKIETDHKLNVRMFITGLALVALYAIIISVMLSLGVSVVLVIIIAGALHLLPVLLLGQGRDVRDARARGDARAGAPLHEIVDRLCLLANMEKPRVGVVGDGHAQRLRDGPQPESRRDLRDARHHEPTQ